MTHEHKHKFSAIILAAGAGTRMRSDMPKVMHTLAGQPMIVQVLNAIAPLAPQHTVVVAAPQMEVVKQAVLAQSLQAQIAIQDKQLGTGHAVRAALSSLKGYEDTVLVLYGDTPLLMTESIDRLLSERSQHKTAIALLGMRPHSPMGYGRLVMRQQPIVERIVECKDATSEEKQIEWVWAGVMAFDAKFLAKALLEQEPSKVTGEYYLTSLIDAATKQNLHTLMVPVDVEEAMGVNDRVQLAAAERVVQQRLRKYVMEQGTTLVDPETVYLSADTVLGRDVLVHPHVVFGAGVSVEDNVEIRSFCHIEGATIAKGAIVGPYARLRAGTHIGEKAHVGNFVELKKTTLGKGAKANHLSYVGDTEVGEGANIGAGTITCNYDGVVNKYKTIIGANVSIGSNSSLVAPVTIGDGAIVGAGSVITDDVEKDALALARAPQINKPKKATKFRAKAAVAIQKKT